MATRALLVEDDEDDAFFVARALDQQGVDLELRVTRDGAEALSILETQPVPQLIILDLNLPRVDGMDVLRRLREDPRTRGTAVVVLTASEEPTDRQQAERHGVELFLRKPTDTSGYARVAEKIKALVARLGESRGR
jgi:two-component system, response regulator